LLRIFLVALGLATLFHTSRVLFGPDRGLQAEYFAGDQPSGAPVISGVDDRVSTERLQARWYGVPPDAFSAQWFGYLTVARPGRYTFALTSDDAAFLSVDGLV
jgi:hypothetical protein